jgi:predicted nucleotidyltransferase component of viral defense system
LDSQKGKARNAAKKTNRSHGELLQLHFYRRLIARVFHADNGTWMLKGGQALLVRWPSARYSTDIDLLGNQDSTDTAVDELIAAAALRLDDEIWFAHRRTFDQTHVERPTRKVTFMTMFEEAPLGYEVNVDIVVAGHHPRGTVTTTALEPAFPTDCGPWPQTRVFPVEDHVAEKICAMYELHQVHRTPSTRAKDLVDLVLIALKTDIEGTRLHRILADEVERRRARQMVVDLPGTFRVPNPAWAGLYREAAQKALDLPDELRALDGVEAFADTFLTPLMRLTPPPGSWRPDERIWR